MAESTDLFSRTPTFHDTDAGYMLPNDPAEHSRLHDQHLSLVALTDNRVLHAPVSNPHTVLDVGCGTGIITRYLGSDQFPNASHVYGIDLSQVPAPQPGEKQAPNVAFIHGDFRKLSGTDPRLQYGSADFVYSRMLECGMTDWPGYVADVFKILKPGGWLELGDYVEDVFFSDNSVCPREDWEWLKAIRTGQKKQHLDPDVGRNHTKYMEGAGFVDVQRWEWKVPFWRGAEKELPGTEKITDHVIDDKWGFYWHVIPKLLEGMEEYGKEDVERFRRDMKSDMKEEKGKYQVFCVTIGRKPEA